MNSPDKIVENLILELRRGTIVINVLSQLKDPKYGYALIQRLEEKEVAVEAGTLYPLLRRLEKQGILKSEWETSGAKPRKYYMLSDIGHIVYDRLCLDWKKMVDDTNQLIIDGGFNDGK